MRVPFPEALGLAQRHATPVAPRPGHLAFTLQVANSAAAVVVQHRPEVLVLFLRVLRVLRVPRVLGRLIPADEIAYEVRPELEASHPAPEGSVHAEGVDRGQVEEVEEHPFVPADGFPDGRTGPRQRIASSHSMHPDDVVGHRLRPGLIRGDSRVVDCRQHSFSAPLQAQQARWGAAEGHLATGLEIRRHILAVGAHGAYGVGQPTLQEAEEGR